MATWAPAQEIRHRELGNLDINAEADITVLSLLRGQFGFADSEGARFMGDRRLVAEMTIRKGGVVWDLNARAGVDWKSYKYPTLYRPQ